MKFLTISNTSELLRLIPDKIVYISSDGNYSIFHQADMKQHVFTVQLGKLSEIIYQQLGKDSNMFIRIGKSLIVNRNYIYCIDVSKQNLTLSDMRSFEYVMKPSKDALKQLKEILQKEVNHEE